MEFNIRKGKSEDMPAVFDLVNELAIFEKEADQVKTDAIYYGQCFNEDVFEVIVAEVSGEIVGMALYYMTFSTWKGKMAYLEDFVVKEEYRSLGIGQALWDEWIAESKRQGAKLVKWQVLDWNEDAIRFYERNGATIEKEWWNGKIIF